jgi:glycosyltransferase involved in cell wall biosynthesis
MALKRLIVVSPLFTVNAPQPARFRELVSRWSADIDITVLSFDTGGGKVISEMGARPALMKFGAAGRLLIGSRLKGTVQKEGGQAVIRRRSGLRGFLKKVHVNRFFFPDIFIVEYFRIRKRLFELAESIRPSTVILSTAPFTLMLLATPLRKKFPQIRLIIDTGDPLYGDSSTYSKRMMHLLFAKRLEGRSLAAADLLVVPTGKLAEHYLSSYKEIIPPGKVKVIENGISEVFMQIPAGRKDRVPPFRMVYAGRFYKKMRDPSELYRAAGTFPEEEILLRVFGNIQERYRPPAGDRRFLYNGPVAAAELAREYGEADLVIYLDNAWGVQVPGKIYEVLAVNRPVLYICRDENSPSHDLVKGLDGVVIAVNDHREIASAIREVMSWERGMTFTRGSAGYTFEALAGRYREIL